MEPVLLLIEDDDEIAEAVALILGEERLRVIRAPDGRSGVAAARLVNVALVLLDLTLPDVGGEQVVARLREAGCTAPIVVLSGAADGLDRARAVGADGFLAKPFDVDRLLEQVQQLLARHEPAQL